MNKLLHNWDRSLTPAQHAQLDDLLSRREFLVRSLKTAGAIAILPVISTLSACSKERSTAQQQLTKAEPWLTFAAVLQQLFPADGNGPDAGQINATLYLRFVLEAKDTDPEERDFIYKGIDWLNDLALQQQQCRFIECTAEQQDQLLHAIADSRSGERWLSYLLTYLIEALLSDPVYGGNPAGIGWTWLEHQAGFPRPPLHKTYVQLLAKRA